jgi:hypothetical protein
VVLTQKEMFGAILLRKHKMFDSVFAGEAESQAVDEPPKEPLKEIDEQYH